MNIVSPIVADIMLWLMYIAVAAALAVTGLSVLKTLRQRTKDDEIINVWSREELGSPSGSFDFSIRFRIITEYVDPNFENVYPEEITRWLDPVGWTAEIGKAYDVHITGGRDVGYAVTVSEHGD